MDVSTVLYRTADDIAVNGHYQCGRLTRINSACVVSGICRAADGDSALEDAAIAAVFDHLELTSGKAQAVIAWNDTPGRTQAEVVSMLRSVADIERQAEAFIASLDAVQVVTL